MEIDSFCPGQRPKIDSAHSDPLRLLSGESVFILKVKDVYRKTQRLLFSGRIELQPTCLTEEVEQKSLLGGNGALQ